MFVHTGEKLPQDPEYPADLTKLGFKVTNEKQIVSIDGGVHFDFFHTDNHGSNEKRKEAVHESVRELVMMDLMEFGVVEVFLGGEKGTEILGVGPGNKPEGVHVPILTTNPEELKKCRDVVVVVGEPNQDAGIWAWRHVMGSGGINGGSAVGFVKKLLGLGLDSTKRDHNGCAANASFDGNKGARDDSLAADNYPKMPGVIILNPGALMYSNFEKKTMTMSTWAARERTHAFGQGYKISPNDNFANGHTGPAEHIYTCFDSILPQLLADDAELYIVGITNSAEYFIDWFSARQCTNGTSHVNHSDVRGLHDMINGMAFMQPTHDATKVKCEAVEVMLREYGRQWIKSSKPLGTFLNTVKGYPKTPELPSLPLATKGSVIRLPDYDAATPSNQVAKPNLDKPIVGEEPVEFSCTSIPEIPELENALESLDLAAANFKAEDPVLTREPSPEVEFPDDDEAEDSDATLTDSYDHMKEYVSCPTFSGEADIDEMLWPNAMDEALDHFKYMAERTAQRGSLAK